MKIKIKIDGGSITAVELESSEENRTYMAGPREQKCLDALSASQAAARANLWMAGRKQEKETGHD